MDWLDKMNKALEYIEDNLDGKIDYEIVAQKACCSSYNFQRMFSFITDVTLAEYIRRRRLTKAALDLIKEDSKIIDIALKYGYESQTAFTRAFQNLHDVTPREAIKEGIKLKSYPKISFQISIKGVEEMNYRIEKGEPMRIIGLSKTFNMKNGENFIEIPKMWSNEGEILYKDVSSGKLKRKGSAVYGICYNFTKETLDYLIGVESEDKLDDGYTEITVPELTWVKFECRGPLPDSQQNVWKRIFTEWLPNSGYEHDNGPEIEWYSGEDPNSETYLSEIWIPIKKSN